MAIGGAKLIPVNTKKGAVYFISFNCVDREGEVSDVSTDRDTKGSLEIACVLFLPCVVSTSF